MDDQSGSMGIMGFLFLLTLIAVLLALAIVGATLTLALSAPPPSPTATQQPVVAATSEATATPSIAQVAADDDSVNRIVIVSALGQLRTVDPDGDNVTQLTTMQDNIIYQFPAWSPNSDQIAVIGAGRGSAPDGVYVFEANEEEAPSEIFSSSSTPIYLYWSPDGQSVSFIAPSAEVGSLIDLHIAPSDGSVASRALAMGQPFYWDWVSDGSAVVINTARSEHAGLAYLDLTTGLVGDAFAQSGLFQSPDISFDDRYVAYSAQSNDQTELVIEDRRSGARIERPHVGPIAMAWSPTVNQLAYIAPGQMRVRTFGPLYLLDIGGEPQLISSEIVIAFFWAPNGTALAYLTLSQGRTTPEAAVLQQVSNQPVQTPQLSFDLWVLDTEQDSQRYLGSFLPSELFLDQFLPFFDQYARSHTIWAPDSSALVLPVSQENSASIIYRFPVDGSQPQPIDRGLIAFWSRR